MLDTADGEVLVADEGLSINRRGVTFVPALEGSDLATLVARLAAVSRTVHSCCSI